MNNKLESIHSAFPFFEKASFYISTPEDHFQDPYNDIIISVWGDQFKVEYNGLGEYQETIYDTAEQVIENVEQYLAAYNG